MSSQSLARIQVRINQIDYTLVPPGELDKSSLPRVPVIRIYGPSSTGQTACVHVHQVYPYLFVEYLGNLNAGYVKRYIAKLFRSLNHAIALSLKRNPHSHNSQYIRAIVLVKGVHFYGFHSAYSPFFKILVADPSYMNRISTILQSGSVMSTRFRVYESHLSYILQFLCDFGLYGCGFIELEDVFERCAQAEEQPEPVFSVLSTPIPFKPSSYFRESRLPLEVDAIAPHILNRHRLAARNVHHRLEIPAPLLPSEPLVLGVRELWEDERNRRQTLGLDASPELPIDPSESSRGVGGDWVAEAHWWDEIRHRIQNTANSSEEFQDKKSESWERFVMTTFESIEAIWEKEYKVWKPAKEEVGGAESVDPVVQPVDKTDNGPDQGETDNQVDVDISKLSNQDISELDQQEALGEGWNKTTEQGQQDHDDKGEVEEEAVLEDDLAEELVEENKVEDSHTFSPENPFLQNSEEAPLEAPPYRLASPRTPTRPTTPERSGVPTPTKSEARLSSVTHGPIEPLRLVSLDDWNGQLDEAIPAKSPITLDDGVLSVEKEVDSENSAEQSQRPVFSGNLTEKNSQDQNLVQSPILIAERRSSLITARAVQLSKAFDTCKATNTNRYIYSVSPPSVSDLKESFESFGLPSKTYQAPYYSKDTDIPEMAKEYGGLTYRLKGGQGIATLTEWASNDELGQNSTSNFEFDTAGIGGWEYASHPPSVLEVRRSVATIDAQSTARRTKSKLQSQIEGPTQANIYGFKTTPIGQSDATRERTEMSIMSLEVFVATRDTKVPDPGTDEVVAVVYAHHTSGSDTKQTGALALQSPQLDQRRLRDMKLEILMDELDLLNRLIDLTVEIDPDILTGWDVQAGSWGYLEARGQTHGLDISELISRAPPRSSLGGGPDQWGMRKTSTFKVTGRHVLNSWRIMRSEKTLTMYTFENVVFEVLGRRVPKYSYKTLTKWYSSPVPAHTSLLLRYLFMRVVTNLELLEETEIVTKTAEFARVFGVDFFSVINRGSQFKVESFLFRIAKPESFVLISPSRHDVGKQNAAECMPLIMEPASAFYSSPLVVLDFQSLYPSIMIAYNYCYSTCLGRIRDFKGAYKLGVNDNFDIPPELLQKLQDHITVAANGIMYVKPNVRKGLLGRMLTELLDTRVMVKQAMKSVSGDKARRRILDARQLGLKYIANVTYGYTGATFSGRMPAVEIADSIVQSGRETLEKAIDVINGNRKWGAKVVYGDTDSVFVYLLGKTKEQAFAIGNEIAATITVQNPAPIKLKFEKVYLPCVLMAKKRYVGFKYESIDDTEPVFDAKGIETVRRDGVLAQRKMVENCLKILFRTQDLSEIKEYCCRSWTKLLENKASVQDFIFAKEVRIGTYSDKVAPPPGAMVATRRTAEDPNDEAQYGDRIPYVIVRGAPGSRLVERAIDPLEFMNNSQLHLDANYYITRVLIPPLERIFNLLGAGVKQWFNEMPKTNNIPEPVSPRKPKIAAPPGSPDRINMNQHFFNAQCLSCGEPASQSLCDGCFMASQETISNLGFRIRAREERLANAHRICGTCTSSSPEDPIQCESLDCPWFYSRRKAEDAMDLVPILAELSDDLEKEMVNKAEESEAGIDSCDEDFYMSDSDATNEIYSN